MTPESASKLHTRIIAASAFLFIVFSNDARGGRVTLPLEEALGYSMVVPASITTSGHNRVAWVEQARGVRNVFVAAAPGFAARRVTTYDADDGQEITGLQFSRDGESVVFVRGGAPNRRGEVPNPRHLPDPVERSIWIAPVSGGAPRKIADSTTAAVSEPIASPDTSWVVFAKGTELWGAEVSGAQISEAVRLFTGRGRIKELVWSPDGQRLAFVSDRSMYGRGGYSFVGVFDLQTRGIEYLAPDVSYAIEPTWSPDGTKIAFIRDPVEPKSHRFSDNRTGTPWSIVVANIETGDSSEVWAADPGKGSRFRALDRSASLFWAQDDRLIFGWEKTGWKLLYSVSADGGPAELLTPGEHEVRAATLSPDRSTIAYSTNLQDPNYLHLWSWTIGSESPQRLTSDPGVQDLPQYLDDGDSLIYLGATARTPARLHVLDVRERAAHVINPVSDDYRRLFDDLSPAEIVTFRASDGMHVTGYLYLPADVPDGSPAPAVIYAHGGSRITWLPVFGMSISHQQLYVFFQYMVSKGYAVLIPDYRSGTGRGLMFREAPGYGGGGASDVRDFIGAGSYLAERADVSNERIAIIGRSYGGHLVSNSLVRAPELFAAGVSIAGVGDWVVEMEMDSGGPLNYGIPARQRIETLAYGSSAISRIHAWKAPALFIHGDDDVSGAIQQTIELVLALRKRGVRADTLIFPGESHGFLLQETNLIQFREISGFLEDTLGR